MSADGYRVGVVGATGAVGSTILEVLAGRDFPAREVVLFASERSAGKRVEFDGQSLEIQPLSPETIQGLDIVLSSAGGSVSAEWAPRFAEAGAVVVDNTSYWRMHDDVPLVVAGVNDEAADAHNGIVANPNCTTMQMVVALKPIWDEVGIERIVVSTYQSVSGTGRRAIEELREQSRAVLEGDQVDPEVFPHQVAFNVIPQVEAFTEGDDYTTEERKVMNETRKILGAAEELGISSTCVRVPVVTGHSESVNVETRDELSPGDVASYSPRSGDRGRGRAPRGDLPAGDRRRGPRRGARGADPPRPLARAVLEHVGCRRQPSKGRCDQRGPGRRAVA